MTLPDGPIVAWYGDDFTGAAAVMEVMTFAGLPAVLFLEPPDADRLSRFDGIRAIGLAGASRAMTPEEMDAELPSAFAMLRGTGAPILHYKICSTLDSAPRLGSIGHAAGLAMHPGEVAPLLVAAPEIGRWQAFGTLFALADGQAVRLDRHPTMSVHPATPMDEADVRLHIARQTDVGVGLVDLRALKAGQGPETFKDAARTNDIVALDVVDAETLTRSGEVVWGACGEGGFVIGSQGVEYALIAAWRQAGWLADAPRPAPAGPVDRIAVVSGSCAPVTAGQIAHAETNGFDAIAFDATATADTAALRAETDRATRAALAALDRGQSPLIATARGPDDPAIAAFRTVADRVGATRLNDRLGETLGGLLRDLAARAGLRRVGIAGGDTSSRGAAGLGLWALTATAPIAPGVALLRGHSDDPALDGIEIALKGGQMGPPELFTDLRAGGPGGMT